jgi:peptidoglycan hydrolase-like protein with peptidoglycan-binding domain
MGNNTFWDANRVTGLPESKKDEYWSPKPKPAPAQEKPKEKAAAQFSITSCKIVVPSDGLKEKKPFDVEGAFEPSSATTKSVAITLDAVAQYSGHPDDTIASLVNAEADLSKKTFKATFKTLYFHQDFLQDKKKPADATFTLKIKAYGKAAEKEFFSEPVTLPMATKQLLLQKDKYDDVWSGAADHAKEYPKSGDNYVPGDKVKKLQENLIKFELLDKGLNTGFFGDKTETAVKEFQKLAAADKRKKQKEGKVFSLPQEKITFKGSADGIVGQKTEDEIAVWLQNDYVKPVAVFVKGDFDENGYQDDRGKREEDGYHEGYQVTDFQKYLKSIGVYTGSLDGWFGPKTQDAVLYFHKAAANGDFVDKSGNKAVLDDKDKLKGHRKGVGCEKTVDAAKKISDKGLKVEDVSSHVRFSSSLEAERQKILSKKSIDVLGAAAKQAGLKTITVTSTIRYPKQQAGAMYTNLSNKKRLKYAEPGMAVTGVYDECVKNGDDKATTIQKMVDKINALSKDGKRVSKHCVSETEYNLLNIVDIDVPVGSAKSFIDELAKDASVQKIYHDIDGIEDKGKVARLAKEPCIHVEIKQ